MSTTKIIYEHSPVWLQNCLVSAQGLVYNHRRWDVELGRTLLSELRRSQWWTEEQFRTFQFEKLRQHIHYAAARIPYYTEFFKKRGIDYRKVQSVEDLQHIPYLEKDVVRDRPTHFLKDGTPSKSWNRLFSSGTTGSPMNLYSSRESFTRVWSFVFRLREWAGLTDPILPRRVQFTGRDIVPEKRIRGKGPYWRRNFPGNALLMSTTHLSYETVPAYVEAIKQFQPVLIDGYPSAIVIVAKVSKALGLDLPRPQAVITSAETLTHHDRQEIESAFGCKVFNQYASSDTGAFVCDCEYGSLHVNPEFGICEILKPDGTPAGPGEAGEIVTTSFCNLEQVFIRYRIGDLAIAGPNDICRCGRRMPRVGEIIGRTDDVLYIPDRGFVGRFDPVFKGLSSIYEAQIIHESLDRLRVKLVPALSYDDSMEEALLKNLRKKVGDAIGIAIEKVDAIPRGPGGKFRSVVSTCRDQYPKL